MKNNVMRKNVENSINKKRAEQEQLIELKSELIEKEYKENLKEKLDLRLNELAEDLSKLRGEPTVIEIKTMLNNKRILGRAPKYTNTELALVFDYYKEFINEINKYTRYLPTKQNFCGFIGVSTYNYNNWRTSEDPERREIIQIIEDYITDVMLTYAQNGDVKEITTMFRTKTEHGYVEAAAPIVIEHKDKTKMQDILKQIEAVNQGRSLKPIDLKKDIDGVYKEENK